MSFVVSCVNAELLFMSTEPFFVVNRVGLRSSLLPVMSGCPSSIFGTSSRRLPSIVWGRSRLFAVKPCRRWTLFVVDSQRGAVTSPSVLWRALRSTVSRFQPALVVSRYLSQVRPYSVCRRVQSLTHGQSSRFMSWTVAILRGVRPSSGTSVQFSVARENNFTVAEH